jgi:deoxyribose-phosphate aldolase
MTPAQLASKIDHTILKPEARAADVDRVVKEAIQYRFASVCMAPIHVARFSPILEEEAVACCSVVGFPHGTSKPTIKAIEATSTIKEGADEIDIVANLSFLLDEDVDSARSELLEIVRAARATRRDVVIKVIVESALLMADGAERGEARLALACRAVRQSGCDFIKTATGFHPAGGATVEAVRLMKKHAEGLLVKAAGGIRDLKTALAMLDAGADRLGMSASVAVLNELASGSGASAKA